MTEPVDQKGRGLALPIAGAIVAAALITVVFVLPAEYGVDPTGIGGALGLTALNAPPEIVVETAFTAPPEMSTARDAPFRSDVIDITVPLFSQNWGQLEYKVTMDEGDVLVYSWTSDRPVLFEFHGHTLDDGSGAPLEVMTYVTGTAAGMNGTLVAPADGLHGWYFANSDFDAPAQVQLTIAGYYRLEPGILSGVP